MAGITYSDKFRIRQAPSDPQDAVRLQDIESISGAYTAGFLFPATVNGDYSNAGDKKAYVINPVNQKPVVYSGGDGFLVFGIRSDKDGIHDVDHITFYTHGIIRGFSSGGLVVGEKYWIASDGSITTTEPVTPGTWAIYVGTPLNSNDLILNINVQGQV